MGRTGNLRGSRYTRSMLTGAPIYVARPHSPLLTIVLHLDLQLARCIDIHQCEALPSSPNASLSTRSAWQTHMPKLEHVG